MLLSVISGVAGCLIKGTSLHLGRYLLSAHSGQVLYQNDVSYVMHQAEQDARVRSNCCEPYSYCSRAAQYNSYQTHFDST